MGLKENKNKKLNYSDYLNLDNMRRTLEKISGKLDLVVDDGWHQPEAGLKTLSVCLTIHHQKIINLILMVH